MTQNTAPSAFKMLPQEKRSSFSLASIFALRMLGLFVILPVFAVYAHHLPGGDSEFLVGVTLGIYGLTQGILQIPFGLASDRFGRKPVIIFGLMIFAVGSFLAAWGDSIWTVMIGRMIQGAGAISAAVTAFISDSVRDTVLTKAMAMVGASIGLTFAVSLVISPTLARWCGVDGLFFITGVLAVLAIGVVKYVVPNAPKELAAKGDEAQHQPWPAIAFSPQLMRLNFGIFSLHAVLTAIFVVVPPRLVAMGLESAHHWWAYLPAVLAGFALMGPLIVVGERRGKTVEVLRVMTVLMAGVLGLFSCLMHSIWEIVFLLALFFMCFNVLEAILPGLISRAAPKADKGLALGIYNTTQNIGLFIGGAVGGWLSEHWSPESVFLCGAVVMLASFLSSLGLQAPKHAPKTAGDELPIDR